VILAQHVTKLSLKIRRNYCGPTPEEPGNLLDFFLDEALKTERFSALGLHLNKQLDRRRGETKIDVLSLRIGG
jgi:hypothetical protein